MSKYVIIALAIIAVVAAFPAEPEKSGYGNPGTNQHLNSQPGAHLNFDNKEHTGTYGQITYGGARNKRAPEVYHTPQTEALKEE